MTRWPWLVVMIGCGSPAASPPAPLLAPPAPPPPATGTWRPGPRAPANIAEMMMLTDGTVMGQELESESWYRLTPDATGSFANGTWTTMAAMPTGYSPLYYASGVLPDGKVVVLGGEYVGGNFAFSTRGAFYNPVADSWSNIVGPPGWTMIGDASGVVLPSGKFMVGACCNDQVALFDEGNATFTVVGTGKRDINDEESWALLPDGTLLTVDANNAAVLNQTEIFDPTTLTWNDAGVTPVEIADFTPNDPNSSHEVGPNVLRYDGSVLAIGGNGHNAIFDTQTKAWSSAPDLPTAGNMQLDVADGPAALLPNGNVLICASPGVFNPPTVYFEWDGTQFTQVGAPAGSEGETSYQHTMLELPTGEILMSDFTPDLSIYTPAPGIADNAVPVITDAPQLADAPTPQPPDGDVATLYAGRTYVLAGDQLNGLSQGAFYGDDVQSYTNYPLIRVTTEASGHVRYYRTFAHSSRSIAPGAHGTTKLEVPADAEPGPGTLEVVVNGIASPAIAVNVK